MRRSAFVALALLAVVSCGSRNSGNKAVVPASEPAGCGSACQGASASESSCCSSGSKSAPVSEVLYFHGKQRCATCLAIERVAKETVASLGGANVAFKVIDFSTPDGEALADSYRVSSSSLLVVSGGKVTDLTPEAFLNARSKPAELSRILKQTIEAAE